MNAFGGGSFRRSTQLISTLLSRAFLAAALIHSVGCGGAKTETPAAGNAAPADTATIKKYDADGLPNVGDSLPPLEQGNLEISPPEGWIVLPYNKNYVCVFAEKSGGKLPRIAVKANDKIIDAFDKVTEENVAAYSAALKIEGKEIIEPAKPIILGDNAYARFVKDAAYKNERAEVQVLMTQHLGRTYLIELQVDAGGLKKFRDQAYAVAANLKFVDKTSSTPDTKPQAETPAPVVPELTTPATVDPPAKSE